MEGSNHFYPWQKRALAYSQRNFKWMTRHLGETHSAESPILMTPVATLHGLISLRNLDFH